MFLVTFGNEVTDVHKYYVIFVHILQGKMGKTGKKQKEDHETEVTKITKTKNMGWKKTQESFESLLKWENVLN